MNHVTQEELALIGRPPDSHAGLQDVRVDLSDTVDGVRSDHAQVSHVDPLGVVLLDQRHPPQTVRVAREHGRNRLGDAATDQSNRVLLHTQSTGPEPGPGPVRCDLTSRCLWLMS